MKEGGGTAPAEAVPCERLSGRGSEEGLGARNIEDAVSVGAVSLEENRRPPVEEVGDWAPVGCCRE